MYKFLLSTLLFILVINKYSNAQTSSLSGKLVEAKSNRPISFATLKLHIIGDTIQNHMQQSDSLGNFIFKNLILAEYRLQINLIGYQSKTMSLTILPTKNTLEIGNILIEEDSRQLATVQITGNRAMFRNRSDGSLEVNVAGSILSTSNSVNEILSKTPGLTIEEQTISVLGKGEAIVYLNGRRATPEQLASLTVSLISKIEVISNPSAKYDAQGNAIINVVTFSPLGEGYNIGLRSQFSVSDFTTPISASNIDANYKKGKLELRGGYGISLGTNREILNTTRTRSAIGNEFRSVLMTDWKRKQLGFSNLSLGTQYLLNRKSYVSMEYLGSLNRLSGITNNTNQILSASLNGSFLSAIDPNLRQNNHSLSLNYHHDLDTLGSALLLATQLSSYRSENDDMILENSIVDNASVLTKVKNPAFQDISLAILQADYTKMLGGLQKIELGGKLSMANTTSENDFYRSLSTLEFPNVPDISAAFNYSEQIAAGYGNLSGQLTEKINYGMGLRMEHTSYNLYIGISNSPIKRNYISLFPSAMLSIKASSHTQLLLAYNNRTSRPRYQALNPSVIYQDAFTSIVGNPQLKPEHIHAMEFATNYRNYSLKLGYTYTLSPISAAALQGEAPNTYILKALNFNSLKVWSIALTAPFSLGYWRSTNTASLNRSNYRADQLDFVKNKSTPQLYLYSSNTIAVKNLFKLQLLGWYQGKRNTGTYFNKYRALVSIGVEKELIDGKLKVNLLVNDIFATDRPRGDYEVGGTFVEYARKVNSRYLRATLSYSFGALKKTSFVNRNVGQTEAGRAM